MKKRSSYKNTNLLQRKPRGRKVTVKESNTLLPFLFDLLKEQSKSSIKSMLGHGQISVNGKTTSQFDAPLEPNDVVGISYERGKVAFNHPMLKIVWEDELLIVVNKKEGLLSVANAKIKERTAYHLLSDYVKKTDPRNKILLLHRLDKDVSGLMMFAKNRGIQEKIQASWNQIVTNHSFIAVVEGEPEKEIGLLTSHFSPGADGRVFITSTSDGKEALTRYKVIRSNQNYSLLALTLEAGRKNNIREQVAQMGNPIAGDKKYGAESNPEGRIMLHSQKLYFIHPETGAEMCFETRPPSLFTSLVK